MQADTRLRAVMALAPMGVAFSTSSLASITVPVAIYAGEKDTFLVPRFHAQWVMQNMRGANTTLQLVPDAGHYAFMNTPTMDLPSPDGSVARDPQASTGRRSWIGWRRSPWRFLTSVCGSSAGADRRTDVALSCVHFPSSTIHCQTTRTAMKKFEVIS